MPASLKIPGFERADGMRFPRRAVVGIIAVLVAATAGLALHLFAAPSDGAGGAVTHPGTSADWAGSFVPDGGDSPETAAQVATYGPREAPLSSSDYTSGFDEHAAGLGPLPASKGPLKLVQPRDNRLCPDDLNCTFRPSASKMSVLPPRRKFVEADADAAKASAPPKPNGLALLTANLHLPIHFPNRWPSANSLFKPFTSVSNTVVGFVKKL